MEIYFDDLEKEIDALAYKIIAMRQPMANDLRTVVSALSIANDLERMGDHATNIAKRVANVKVSMPSHSISMIVKMGDDVQIMMSEGVLSLEGKRASCREDNAGEVRCAERVSGEFKRSFSLPDTADPNGITANYRNGVLKITITKEEKTAPKRIKIKAL